MPLDITDMYSAMKQVKYKNAQKQLEKVIKEASSLDEAIRRSLFVVCETIQCEKGKLWVLEQYGTGLIVPKNVYGAKEEEDSPIHYGQGIVGKTIKEGIPYIENEQKKKIDRKKEVSFNGLYIPLNHKGETFGCIELIDKLDGSFFDEEDLEFAMNLSNVFTVSLIKNNLQFEFVEGKNGKTQLLKGLSYESRKIAVLFVDINGFSSLIRKVGLKESIDVLNNIYSLIANVAESMDGYIDKYMGSKAMILFNAPKETEDYIYKAAKTALLLKYSSRDLFNKIEKENQCRLGFGFGLSSGTAGIGSVGTKNAYSYTAIGNCVNIANRLSGLAKEGYILTNKSVYKELKTRARIVSTNKAIRYSKDETIEIFNLDTLLSDTK